MERLGGTVLPVHNRISDEEEPLDLSRLKGLKLLLGMNDAINMLYMTHIFKRCEVEADVGSKAGVIFDFAGNNSYDVILLDTSIPKIDDITLISNVISLQEKLPQAAAVAVLTAYPFPDKLDPLKQAGIKGVIAKPYSENDIVTALIKLLTCK